MLRRLHAEQPETFAFTPDNQKWAEAQIKKYPEGRQASAIIPLLWRAQEQEGWLSRPAIEAVAAMLDLAYIRALEVATFYFMFQLQPVGSVAHIQVCGTTSCMICGAEDLVAVCKEKIAANPHQISDDGKFSWEEVECLGACANAPMAQIGKDYYEDLTADSMGDLIDRMAKGEVPTPGSQTGRYAAEPASGLTSLKDHEANKMAANASVALATEIGDTIKRIDGTEVPLVAPWIRPDGTVSKKKETKAKAEARAVPLSEDEVKDKQAARPTDADAGNGTGRRAQNQAVTSNSDATNKGVPDEVIEAPDPARAKTKAPAVEGPGEKPELLSAARDGGPDDLKQVKGVGPKLETLLHELGVYHFDQIASWSDQEVAWVDQNLEGFKGRVSRDEWVKQAKILAKGGTTEFSSRVEKGGVY
ncbi:NADH-quinone oxidoreductase subunit E [Litoreibacter roseus]|uniref:NADH dehydrogenase subunit E n=1 Tax=Litoreibacter roseus TaxID=2601869 RepID=A0A6N6JHR0_9RHOB|nr:NADH-quinone oxidoreductase subunit E [Litoreibacter roseus]GFE65796.1 hypothetical protein KIN_28700 [Litoreibacter roseus]